MWRALRRSRTASAKGRGVAPERRTAPVRGSTGDREPRASRSSAPAPAARRRPGRMTPSAEMWGPVRTAMRDPAVRVPGQVLREARTRVRRVPGTRPSGPSRPSSRPSERIPAGTRRRRIPRRLPGRAQGPGRRKPPVRWEPATGAGAEAADTGRDPASAPGAGRGLAAAGPRSSVSATAGRPPLVRRRARRCARRGRCRGGGGTWRKRWRPAGPAAARRAPRRGRRGAP